MGEGIKIHICGEGGGAKKNMTQALLTDRETYSCKNTGCSVGIELRSERNQAYSYNRHMTHLYGSDIVCAQIRSDFFFALPRPVKISGPRTGGGRDVNM